MKYIILITSLLLQFSLISGQNKQAKDLYAEASSLLNKGEYLQAIKSLKASIAADDKYVPAYLLIADIYMQIDRIDGVALIYRDLVKNVGEEYPLGYLTLAETESYLGNYQDALSNLEKFISLKVTDPTQNLIAKRRMDQCKYAIEAIKNPVPFKPINLGPNVNSKYDEYLPALTADEQTLVITRKLPKPAEFMNENDFQEDFFVSKKDSDEWTRALSIGHLLNSQQSEGAQSISADGKYMFFTACNRPEGKGDCDIYFTKKHEGNWLRPMNIGPPVNTADYEGQPSITADGRTLYFISNRAKSIGQWDIWKTNIDEKGEFSVPENLGPLINTTNVEQSPFIHQDNQTLYFSSYGHTGMGSNDIYYSRKDAEGNWQKPENIGYPINTSKNESSLIVNAEGNTAYFASERDSNLGGMDIYRFELYEKARPVATTYFKGIVFDSESKIPLKAKFELIDLETGNLLIESYSDQSTGEFLVCLTKGKNYALNSSREGYLFFSENFAMKEMKTEVDPFIMNVPLQAIKAGLKVVLKNVFFDTNKYDLKPESKVELDKLVTFLTTNPDMKIELSGHTDDVGNDNENQTLSENRAKAVYDYLIQKSVAPERLTHTGYGEKQPLAANDNEQGRAMNRRTEFKVLEN